MTEEEYKDIESIIFENIERLVKETIVSVFAGSSSVLDKTDPRSVLPNNGLYWSSGAS